VLLRVMWERLAASLQACSRKDLLDAGSYVNLEEMYDETLAGISSRVNGVPRAFSYFETEGLSVNRSLDLCPAQQHEAELPS
jgi:hypothetical protein